MTVLSLERLFVIINRMFFNLEIDKKPPTSGYFFIILRAFLPSFRSVFAFRAHFLLREPAAIEFSADRVYE